MSAAPKKEPSTLPSPPTITMATSWIDNSMWNWSGEIERR
jgi:hypothetical protein